MEKLHFFNILLHLFLLHCSSANTPPPNQYFINCGSKLDIKFSDGRNFVGDLNSGWSFSAGQSKSVKDSDSSTETTLYQTARIYRQTSAYEFTLSKHGSYMVRLHFYAFKSKKTNLVDALFNVSASNISLLSNFSVKKNTSFSSPVIKEFLLNINVEKFIIYFIPAQKTSLAFVNAIEVLLAPENYGIGDATRVTSVGSNGNYNGLLSQVLQTIHRINVGGDTVNDTNLFRNWESDEKYLIPGSSGQPYIQTGLNPKYQDEQQKLFLGQYQVYETSREVGLNDESIFSRIDWHFQVNKNASYLVRAHFCDVFSDSPNVLNFSFFIYGNFNQTISPNVDKDIRDLSAPIYYDFLVESDDSGFINISVAIQKDSITKIAYLNGLEIMQLMKERDTTVSIPEKHKNRSLYAITGSAGGVATVFLLVMAILWGLKCRKEKLEDTTDSGAVLHHGGYRTVNASASPVPNLNLKLKMPLVEILEATQNFDTKFLIGEGGFGKVYKGTLNGVKVAVKRSDSRHGQGLPEFQTEIFILSKIRHRHLVSLIGYCDQGSEMILVYEFMEKGTLRDHLYNLNEKSETGSFTQPKLTWKQRLEICIGSAQGLNYLHTGADGRIIHRDVKSTNILLDEHCVAKVADFGLSQSGPPDPDDFSMGVKGSFGYFDPEYFRSFELTDKSDVYSFGVVLLEVLCARPAIINSTRVEEVNLAEWGMFWHKKGELEKIIDPLLVGEINISSLRKFGEIVDKCLKENGADRPSMCDVFWDLEYALQLQKTAVNGDPHEDSTIDASLELTRPVSSRNFSVEEDVSMAGGDTTATGVFSQLRIDGAR